MSNGNGEAKDQGTIDVDDSGKGFAFFHAGKRSPPVDALPGVLSTVLVQWMKDHPRRIVRTTLGLVASGNTIGFHVWYDEVKPSV